jgi:hypothetical protein
VRVGKGETAVAHIVYQAISIHVLHLGGHRPATAAATAAAAVAVAVAIAGPIAPLDDFQIGQSKLLWLPLYS